MAGKKAGKKRGPPRRVPGEETKLLALKASISEHEALAEVASAERMRIADLMRILLGFEVARSHEEVLRMRRSVANARTARIEKRRMVA